MPLSQFSILDFIAAKVDRGGGDNWSCKTCKAPVKIVNSTQLFTGQMLLCCPTNSVKALKGNKFLLHSNINCFMFGKTNGQAWPLVHQFSFG